MTSTALDKIQHWNKRLTAWESEVSDFVRLWLPTSAFYVCAVNGGDLVHPGWVVLGLVWAGMEIFRQRGATVQCELSWKAEPEPEEEGNHVPVNAQTVTHIAAAVISDEYKDFSPIQREECYQRAIGELVRAFNECEGRREHPEMGRVHMNWSPAIDHISH